MHPNEVKITEDNVREFIDLATSLGHGHLTALAEQMNRQNYTQLIPLRDFK